MILSGKEIEQQLKLGKIDISPFDSSLVNPNSYNYRISNQLYEVVDSPLDAHKKSEAIKIEFNDDGYILQPNKLYLSSTYEEIGSSEFVVSLIGRSSIGRLGLYLQITADMSQLGAKHCWTLELHVVQPVKIYPGMKIGQVSFWTVAGDTALRYSNKESNYAEYSHPQISNYYEELYQ